MHKSANFFWIHYYLRISVQQIHVDSPYSFIVSAVFKRFKYKFKISSIILLFFSTNFL